MVSCITSLKSFFWEGSSKAHSSRVKFTATSSKVTDSIAWVLGFLARPQRAEGGGHSDQAVDLRGALGNRHRENYGGSRKEAVQKARVSALFQLRF